ncbi:MAG: UDP-N-acetylglucosamine 2-epimerase (non-hydrolyzing) [Thermodesulfobacteriota bacterium]|nr:UDP-N-acetylglucosamine 2-epimerase (non-hydrolyzing) [Thermodesulfobacteriota bacterium]
MKESQIAVVVGTRPGLIKMSGIIRHLENEGILHFVIHTGQHYSPKMDEVFMQELGINSRQFRVSDSHDKVLHGAKTAHMLSGVEEILIKNRPGAVLVCGDADTNLAAGLASRKLHIILGHVESGLRSGDWTMPEEHNRVILDHISDLLFAPTEDCVYNLRRECVRGEVHLTGNTVVDAVMGALEIAKKKSAILEDLKLEEDRYILLTTHREENVDNFERLSGILKGIELVLKEVTMPAVFPIHPRTRKRMNEFGLDRHMRDLYDKGLEVIEPLGYFDFLMLLRHARIILTDSGGLQEEACILNKATVTLRYNTERPETVEIGTNVLAGTDPLVIKENVKRMLEKETAKGRQPYGDGKASERIVRITVNALEHGVDLSNYQEHALIGRKEPVPWSQ